RRHRARALAQPDRARRRRDAEGAASAPDRPARDADEPPAVEEPRALRRGRRHRRPGDAGLLPAAEDARRPRRLHGGEDPVAPRRPARPLSGLDRRGGAGGVALTMERAAVPGADALSQMDKDPAKIAGMFDAIAAKNDLLNTVLSGGVDRYWRWRAVRSLALTGRETAVDLCTGTADL